MGEETIFFTVVTLFLFLEKPFFCNSVASLALHQEPGSALNVKKPKNTATLTWLELGLTLSNVCLPTVRPTCVFTAVLILGLFGHFFQCLF